MERLKIYVNGRLYTASEFFTITYCDKHGHHKNWIEGNICKFCGGKSD
jgi:hypothetical protein